MKRKIKVLFWVDHYFDDYNTRRYGGLLIESVTKKINNTVVELYCIPNKNFKIDITDNISDFGFTEDEMKFILNDNCYYKIKEIYVMKNYIQIDVDKC